MARTVMVAALAVVLLAVGTGLGYVLWGRQDSTQIAPTGGSDTSASVAGVDGLRPGVPTIVSLSQLEDMGAEQGPIYWAGPRAGTRYEVTVTDDGATYVRYLPDGVLAGSNNRYLTVGTYGSLDGYDALADAKKKDADIELSKTGAVIATFHSAPDSTYFAFPKADFQVEVFSPVAGQARQLTDSGAITLVPSG